MVLGVGRVILGVYVEVRVGWVYLCEATGSVSSLLKNCGRLGGSVMDG